MRWKDMKSVSSDIRCLRATVALGIGEEEEEVERKRESQDR